jgi:hypothetical protein
MAELEQFEARLAASLERLADEIPTAVDPRELTAAIATAEAGHRWLRPWFGGRPIHRVAVLRYAAIAAALLLLAAAAAVLAPRFMAAPFGATIHGRMTCTGPSLTSSTNESVELECVSLLPDSRLAGSVRIALDRPLEIAGGLVRSGAIELSGDGARWNGAIQVTTAPNESAFGDGWLQGSGAAVGQALYLHVMSSDGQTWGVLGTVASGR